MDSFLIQRLGHHGDGIAEGPVFAPLTLPGETVTGTREGDRLRDVRIVTPSEHRVSPPCSHFKACGGCQLQHASDEFVSDWKQNIAKQALAANGLEAEFRPIITSAAQSRRRATLSAKRTKNGAMAGFHARGSGVIIQIPNCTLILPELRAAIAIAESMAIAGASRRGEINVTATVSLAGLDISVTNGLPLDGPLLLFLAQEAERLGLARLAWDGEIIATRHAPAQPFGAAKVTPPPGTFLQATQDGERALLQTVQDAIDQPERIVDLFAGCGTFSLPLAKNSEVHAVEGDKGMIKALDQGWRVAQNLKRVTSEARDLFRRPLLDDELRKFDACVIDPPRAGAEAQIAVLAESKIAKIAYVSCSPVTFARDIKHMVNAGYHIDWVQVIDQFRWSSHIELVACLTYNPA